MITTITKTKTRLGTAVALALTLAALSAPSALAEPDGYQPQLHALEAGVSPDAFERYSGNNPGTASDAVVGHRDGADGYQPQLHAPAVSPADTSSGISWSNVGAGAAFGFVLSLLAGGALVVLAGRRVAHP